MVQSRQSATSRERDIRRQILTEDAVAIQTTLYGELYEIRASLTGPNKTTLKVKAAWI